MPNYVIKSSLLYHIKVLVLIILCAACATPIAPTGGPRDTEGPSILETSPVTGTTNFSGKKFDFYFDEWVNRGTVASNITIEPDLDIRYSLHWKRKRLTISFEDDLPDSTTIILTLGADITDVRSNKIGAPITIAVSTGDEIDEGTITGKLRSANTGEALETQRVLLYRTPVDFGAKATYQADTDTGGVFRFSYLREGNYKAIYVDDRNRNKIWDLSEDAQPFNRESITLEKAGSDTLDVLYVIRRDTLAPRLQGVGLFSANRMRLRFNENITYGDSVNISVTDTAGNWYSGAYPLYISAKDPFVLYVQSDTALSETASYSLSLGGVTDAAGNQARSDGIEFPGSSQPDTTSQRIIEGYEQKGLAPGDPLEIIYAAPITDPMIFDSLVVVEGDVSFEDWPNIQGFGNRLYVSPQGTWIEGITHQFLAWNPVTQRRKLFNPEIWDPAEMGELEVRVEGADSTDTYHLLLESEEAHIRFDTTFSENVLVPELPPVSYILTVFKDANGNGKWDTGSIIPYYPPEPFYKQNVVRIQTAFTSEVIIEF